MQRDVFFHERLCCLMDDSTARARPIATRSIRLGAAGPLVAEPRPGRCLEPASGGGIVLEETATADVLTDLFEGAMTSLFHDGALGSAAFGGRSGKTGAERVAGEEGEHKIPGETGESDWPRDR